MRVWNVEDRFLMNTACFDEENKSVIKIWESPDLVSWTYLGESHDVQRPDKRRVDAMDVISVEKDGKTEWYGYGTGGIFRSEDGVKWRWVKSYAMNNYVYEAGGCQQIGGQFYLLGARAGIPDGYGYSVVTLRSEDPLGPFVPDYEAFRLFGYSGRRTVNMWAHYCRKPGELLLAQYTVNPKREEGKPYFCMGPMKKPVVRGGHLHMGYWPGNEAVKGEAVAIAPADWKMLFCGKHGEAPLAPVDRGAAKGFLLAAEAKAIRLTAPGCGDTNYNSWDQPNCTAALLARPFDPDQGYVVEGRFRTRPLRWYPSTGVGFFLEEEENLATAVVLEGGGITRIGKLSWSPRITLDTRERSGFDSALVRGIPWHARNRDCTFRMLFRRNLFEVYVDDMLVHAYASDNATGRFGLMLYDSGEAVFSDLRAWQMDLADEPHSVDIVEIPAPSIGRVRPLSIE
jgi:hypothetical protein